MSTVGAIGHDDGPIAGCLFLVLAFGDVYCVEWHQGGYFGLAVVYSFSSGQAREVYFSSRGSQWAQGDSRMGLFTSQKAPLLPRTQSTPNSTSFLRERAHSRSEVFVCVVEYAGVQAAEGGIGRVL